MLRIVIDFDIEKGKITLYSRGKYVCDFYIPIGKDKLKRFYDTLLAHIWAMLQTFDLKIYNKYLKRKGDR